MDFVWIIGIIVGAIIVIAIVAAALRGMRPKVPEVTPGVPVPIAPEVVAKIDDLVRADSKIVAIKTLREHTGESLQSAKRRIDHWRVGAAPATTAIPIQPPVFHDVGSLRASLPSEAVAEIDRLVSAEQQIAAIKLLREEAGLGLKESKDLIDAWRA
ncbi:hypothetical protein KZC52_12785 [Microbacterium sp. kSW2-24]|uniref:hypothetical protein n=1 Tax=Microbacterium TaxID=33882 RepID=UPI001FFD72D4|nr:hypothetical protein [Microbacterium galbinum]MCK2023806.1 hypothetical protein [Microbacterium galbinum]